MGILADLLNPHESAVDSLNGGVGALTLAGTAPLSFSRVDQTITGAIVVPGAARGYLLHHGVTGWGGLAPPPDDLYVLMGNGTGANLTWVRLNDSNDIGPVRVGNSLEFQFL